ncbi:class I SAM-dependent methyltransferase [Patescibacteria group bacterium]
MVYIYQPHRILLERIVNDLKGYIEGDILNAGCGSYDRYEFDGNVIKMDIIKKEGVVYGDIHDIPFEDKKFDNIVCTEVLEHVKDPQLALKEIYRVLKDGGKVLLTVPQGVEVHEAPHHYWKFTEYGIKMLAENVGFRIIKQQSFGNWYSSVHHIIIRKLIKKFDLYNRPIVGRIVSRLSRLMMRFKNNDDHILGWCFVLKK